jgi:YidC/Oxa1 family membrane protein insertase
VDNRRLLFATVLSALIMVVWSYLFQPPTPTETAAPTIPAATTESGAPVPSITPETALRASQASGALAEAAAPPPATAALTFGEATVAASEERTWVLENEQIRLEFSNRGAQLRSALLKEHTNNEGKALDLVQPRGIDPYPFGVLTESGRGHELNNALFVAEEIEDSVAGRILRFRHQSGVGVAEKTFSFDPDGFLDVKIAVGGLPRWGMLFGPGLDDQEGDGGYGQPIVRSIGVRQGEEDVVFDAGDVEEEQLFSTTAVDWAALEDNFFFAAILPREGFGNMVVRPVWRRPVVEPGKPRFLAAPASGEKDLTEELLLVSQAQAGELRMKAYFGAKQYSFLAKQPYGLEHTVRWGMLFFLAKPLYLILEWIRANVVDNYGWAIVIVTFLIKLVFFPLTYKGQNAMSKMQDLNPKIQAIRTKYRPKLRDKQGKPNFEAQRQMNDEVMALYRTAGVNPASGCLPMLLQMPVFFAFYKLLTLAVELRQAPWIFWIKDLSTPDPIFILPLVMGATSVLLQRMTPSPPDPLQARLLQIMPIMFTVFAFAFPSGLVVYWLTNNILTMAQQAILKKPAVPTM